MGQAVVVVGTRAPEADGQPGLGGGLRRIPVSQLALRAPRLDHFEDPQQIVSERRIRRQGDGFDIDEEAVSMCTMIRADGGGSLRTFSGNRAHENGWHTSAKAGRLLHWEGETALWKLIESDTDPKVAKLATESVAFEFVLYGALVRYTCDIEQTDPAGQVTLIEVKRTDRDLDDRDYRLKLAYVREVCRRCGIGFRIVFRDEIYSSLLHRRNAGLFASRGLVPIRKRNRQVVADQRCATGHATYGALAEALEPGHAVAGKALIQAMVVHRLVQMDLTRRLDDASPVIIV